MHHRQEKNTSLIINDGCSNQTIVSVVFGWFERNLKVFDISRILVIPLLFSSRNNYIRNEYYNSIDIIKIYFC